MINLITWTVFNYVGDWQFPVLRNCSCDHILFTQCICLEKNAYWQAFSDIATNFKNCLETLYKMLCTCFTLVLSMCNVLDKWGLEQLDVRQRMSRFANAGQFAKLPPVLSLLWKLKGVGCVSCAFYNVLTLELDVLPAVSSVCSLQLLLMRQSVRGASWCSTERLLLGEPALAGSKGCWAACRSHTALHCQQLSPTHSTDPSEALLPPVPNLHPDIGLSQLHLQQLN